MTMFYVYLHRKANTKEVFYVGKGHSKRAYAKISMAACGKRKTAYGYGWEYV